MMMAVAGFCNEALRQRDISRHTSSVKRSQAAEDVYRKWTIAISVWVTLRLPQLAKRLGEEGGCLTHSNATLMEDYRKLRRDICISSEHLCLIGAVESVHTESRWRAIKWEENKNLLKNKSEKWIEGSDSPQLSLIFRSLSASATLRHHPISASLVYSRINSM